MSTKGFIILCAFLCSALLLSSCTESDTHVEEKTSIVSDSVDSSKGVVYRPSELALLMRKMYDNMKVVGEQINSGEQVSDSLLMGYETIVSAKATNPDEIDGKYYGFANMWVSEVELMRDNPSIENYNNIMTSCVNCHKSYCPGPIPKIKKLKLIP